MNSIYMVSLNSLRNHKSMHVVLAVETTSDENPTGDVCAARAGAQALNLFGLEGDSVNYAEFVAHATTDDSIALSF